jgi:cobalt-zinc-cadmium efflux system membrane fusion protein
MTQDVARWSAYQAATGFALAILCTGCMAHGSHDGDGAAETPLAVVEHDGDTSAIQVDHPEQFKLSTAAAYDAAPELSVTGVVNPDVSRNVPVVSLAAGRVVDVRARLGDRVQRGQVLLRIQSADVAAAFADYRKAVADQALVESQRERATVLFQHGAIAKKDEEVAQDAAAKALVDVENASEKLRVLGTQADRPPAPIVDVIAPVSGVITEQNVTNAGAVKSLDNSPNLFTISDLSQVWIVCDVYENDLPTVQVGDAADIRLGAFPTHVLKGRISNIAPILDPTLHTAKVRIEVVNPGTLRIGMFVTATFRGRATETHAVVPAAAVLHLRDRDWVYVHSGHGRFERREVVGGLMLPDDMQELRSGLDAGEQVIADALVFQNTAEH